MKRYKKGIIVLFAVLLILYLSIFKVNIFVHKNIYLSHQYFYDFEDDLQVYSINIRNYMSSKKNNLILLNFMKDKDLDEIDIYIQKKNKPINKGYNIDVTKVVVKENGQEYSSDIIKKDFFNSWSFIDTKLNREKFLREETHFSVSRSTIKYVPDIVSIYTVDKDLGRLDFSISFDKDIKIHKGCNIEVYYDIDGEAKGFISFEVIEKKYRYEVIDKFSYYLQQF